MVEANNGTRCGFVALIGAPNVGKSTLVNALVGSKVTIVSKKVQTTRALIRGIVIEDSSQIILVDTPGIFAPRRRLDRAMVTTAWSGAHDADLVCLLLDARKGIDEEADAVFDRLDQVKHPKILVINKIDTVARETLLALAQSRQRAAGVRSDVHGRGDFRRRRCRSAHGDGQGGAGRAVPLSGRPDVGRADAASRGRDHPREDLSQAASGTAVSIDRRDRDTTPSARTARCGSSRRSSSSVKASERSCWARPARPSRRSAPTRRRELAEIVGHPVHLFLFVKVRENWGDDPDRYREMGLEFPKE